MHGLAPSTQRLQNAARDVRTVSPRVRMAARLYASAAVPTKKAAASAVGITPMWLNLMAKHNEETKRLISDVDTQIMDQSVEMSSVLRVIGREAIKRIRGLMSSESEGVSLKAAIDLADRNPETSKVQRHEIVSAHISSEDAKELARSLVEAANVRLQFEEVAQGNIVRVNTEVITDGTLRRKEATDAGIEAAEASGDEDQEIECVEVAHEGAEIVEE